MRDLRRIVTLTALAGSIALTAAVPADARLHRVRSGDARLCATAKSVHKRWADDWAGFQRHFSAGHTGSATAFVILLEDDVDLYRQGIRRARPGSANGRALRRALLTFASAADRSNGYFEAALRAAEANEDTAGPFSDGMQVVARAAARIAPVTVRAHCTLPAF